MMFPTPSSSWQESQERKMGTATNSPPRHDPRKQSTRSEANWLAVPDFRDLYFHHGLLRRNPMRLRSTEIQRLGLILVRSPTAVWLTPVDARDKPELGCMLASPLLFVEP